MVEDLIVNKIFAEIDRAAEKFLRFTTEMVNIPTVNPPGDYADISLLVNDRLRTFGLESRILETPGEMVKTAGLLFPRPNVIGRLPGASSNKKGVLCVHLDTVPVENEHLWKHPPFSGEIEGGKLWGRGACDCKGRLASFALALAAIKDSRVLLGGDVILAATCDEEIGGKLGAGYLVSNGDLNGDFCIVEGFLNEMIYGYAGSLHMKFIARGKAAHTATPWRGENAIQKMQEVMEAIGRVQDKLARRPSQYPEMRYSTLNIGVIKGGAKATIVPDYCEMEVDGRLIPEDTPEGVLELIKGELAKTDEGASFYELLIGYQSKAYQSDRDSMLIQSIQESLAMAGFPSTPIPVTMSRGGGDMKYFIGKGIPSVAFGAGRRPDSNIHGADENILISDFILAAKTTAAVLIRMLGAR